MNYEKIAEIFLTLSVIGMATIIFRKIPVLVSLPEIEPIKKESLISVLKRKIKILNPLKNFSYEIFLQKIIYKIRLLSLKTDSKTFHWLQRLRKRSQQKKLEENEKYWQELKKSIDEEKPENKKEV